MAAVPGVAYAGDSTALLNPGNTIAGTGPQYVYAFGQATPVSSKNDIYSLANQAAQAGYSPQEIAQQLANNPYGISYQELSSGNYGSADLGGSTGGTVNADADPTALAQGRSAVSSYVNQLNDIYNSLYGQVNAIASDKRNQLQTQYGTQASQLNNDYQTTLGQLQNQYGARGLADSSFDAKGLGQAGDTYNTNNAALMQNYNSDLANIGQYAQSTLGGYQAAQKAYDSINPNGIGSVSTLQSDQSQLQQALQSLQSQQAGLGTQSDYINKINSIAPYQQQGSTALQSQLATLAQSSVPAFAKTQIAGALTQQQQQDPAFYQDYFQKLLAQQQTPTGS